MLLTGCVAVAVVLVALGGLLTAADAAVAALSPTELVQVSRSARAARSIRAIAQDPHGHLSAVGLVRAAAETTAVVLVALAVQLAFDRWWLTLLAGAAVMTGVAFVVVGVSPRSIGRAHSAAVVRWSAPLVRLVRVVAGPVASGLVKVGSAVTPGRAPTASVASEEQLLTIVDEAAEHDVLHENDRDLIHSVVEFSDTAAREVMMPRTDMVTIDRESSVSEAMSLLLSRRVSRIPVTAGDADTVTGVVYLRDVARYVYERDDATRRLDDTDLARPALFVPESKRVAALLRQMQSESNHLAMVIDEYGGIAGLVTLEDIIEEIVGEILDEYDRDVDLIEPLADGRYRVSARVPLDEVGALFGLELDDDDVDSVGGLMTKWLGRLPSLGMSVESAGLRLTAERMDGRRGRLSSLIAERCATADDDAKEEHD